ncbi:MAG: PD40 domain-containing protein [Thermoleophilia bacterium]|nr:PD40 domain-containing protein [Thermoleophilia bacterium]
MLGIRARTVLGIATVATASALAASSAPGAEEPEAPVTALVSRAGSDGPGGDGNSREPSISADGRYIAFASRARNLSPAAKQGRLEVYVRDLVARKTELVSRVSGTEGAAADGNSAEPSISADGRYIAFRSLAENLSAEDVAGSDIFVRDLTTGTTELVSRATGVAGPAADEYSTAPSIPADGRHVAFESLANNLSAEDADAMADVFVRDLDLGVTELISRASGLAGTPGDNLSTEPSISTDGRYVAFTSRAPLSADDVDEPSFPADVFLRDRAALTTILVSRKSGPAGKASEVESSEPAISADGRFVAFESDAKLTGQRGFGPNAFLRDTVAATTQLVTVGEIIRAGNPNRNPSVSADGRYVAFQTQGNGVTAVDGANRVDVFVRDMKRGVTVDAARASGEFGVPGDGPSFNASISADGRFVAFDSRAANLSGSDDDEVADVFRRQPTYVEEVPLPGCAGRPATIIGTERNDKLIGTKRADVILALGGDDHIRSLSAPDVICAGAGRDHVDAGSNGEHGGGDLVLGGPGDDRLVLRPELGTLKGGPGDDALIGSKGGDSLYGGAGDDLLRGGPNPTYNSDFLYGGPGDDLLIGGPGPNNLNGGPGKNRLVGQRE